MTHNELHTCEKCKLYSPLCRHTLRRSNDKQKRKQTTKKQEGEKVKERRKSNELIKNNTVENTIK